MKRLTLVALLALSAEKCSGYSLWHNREAASLLSQGSIMKRTLSMTQRDPIRMPGGSPQVPYKPPGSDYTQFIDLESAMYRDRTMFVSEYITDETANKIISILLYLRNEDARAPISMYFNVPGAQLRPALAIYDLMQNTKKKCEINTINIALTAGMGTMLCAAGTKGKRGALPNARFMLQRTGMNQVFQGQATDIGLEVRNIKSCNDRMEEELSLLTGQKVERIHEDLKRDFYLFADEAVQYGLIDQVLPPNRYKRASLVRDADLGAFNDGQDKFQDDQNRGGWGSRQEPTLQREKDDDEDDGPKIAKI